VYTEIPSYDLAWPSTDTRRVGGGAVNLATLRLDLAEIPVFLPNSTKELCARASALAALGLLEMSQIKYLNPELDITAIFCRIGGKILEFPQNLAVMFTSRAFTSISWRGEIKHLRGEERGERV
jgi:hypothetical protein